MRIHLIAVGGAVMHNLAIALYKNGHAVTGSDDEIYNPARDRLASYGLLPHSFGWDADRITDELDLVIIGMHARADNPELLRCQELGIPIHSFPSYMAEHAKDKKRIVVAGSHGKTTTTSMIMHVLKYYNQQFDYLVGAQIEGFDTMVQLSDAPIVVIEGDEYLSSALDRRPKFLHYRPHISILTGIAWDHINVFPTFEEYVVQFENYLQTFSPESTLFYYQNDQHIQKILDSNDFPFHSEAYTAFDTVVKENKTHLKTAEGETAVVQIFGQHNFENLRAAYLVCKQLNITDTQFLEAIAHFTGAAKRLQLLFDTPTTTAWLDFAHAPSKVNATTKAVKAQNPYRKLMACLELHTFSSLNARFLPEYKHALNAANQAVVFYNEHTLSMKKLPPLEKEVVAAAFDHPDIEVITDKEAFRQFLKKQDWRDTNLLLMTSGNFGGLDMKGLKEWIEV